MFAHFLACKEQSLGGVQSHPKKQTYASQDNGLQAAKDILENNNLCMVIKCRATTGFEVFTVNS